MKYIYIILVMFLCSCIDYLDKAPEAGLSDEMVFSKLENTKKFFRGVYEYRQSGQSNFQYTSIRTSFPLNISYMGMKFGFESFTDLADPGRILDAHKYKRGEMMATINYFTYSTAQRPIFDAMFRVIRICNRTLENIDRIVDASPEEIEDLRGQAFFIRGWAHFSLIRLWGPMPYITASIGGNDSWDIPRLSIYESYQGVANDMDLAFEAFEKAGKIRRDPQPGEAGHLDDPDQDLPNGVAAKAMKARALLYSASPLSNSKGEEQWKEAAAAAWNALKTALDNGYSLMPFENYTDNFYGVSKYCNEHLWAWNAGTFDYKHSDLQGILAGVLADRVAYQSGEFPTQNLVDKFETKWGEPLDTEESRKIAESLGHYNEQMPYENRDPRLAKVVIYNQADIVWPKVTGDNRPNKANLFYKMVNGMPQYSDLLSTSYQGRSFTGYMSRKYYGDISKQNNIKIQMTDPLLRLGELYLIYAEAANEAYGPNGRAKEASLTALEALNIVRERANMPNVLSQYSSSKEALRERIKNERTIELCMEGNHRYFDMRRWKDAPNIMSTPIYGIDVEKVEVSEEYPTGFKYKRVELTSDRQPRWYEFMYYLPFHLKDYNNLNVFDTSLNPQWY